MLIAAAAQAGYQVTDLGIARDTQGDVAGCLDSAIAKGVDVLITTGGVSMGDRDWVKPLLQAKGTIHFGRVLMKPGKPLTFATLELPQGRQMLVFGLPGNPVSSFVCFHLVALPALRKMAGWASPGLRRVHVRLANDIKMDPERPEYHRATLQYSKCPTSVPGVDASAYGWWALSTGKQASSRLLSARSANTLLEIPQTSGVLPAGSTVPALLIEDLQGMPEPHAVDP
ncbi:MoaB/Mog domain-containing protein [Dunaliella salina]|nr:MoaB/Mog domain-containing protein [Dunaliella salina]|eukprot:KAF5838303.1 MoaB/Mog domain-containing protein [Dunaliella salina]